MSQSELALLIGASRPKVNTALCRCSELSGAFERSEGRFICDIEELLTIAGAE